MIKEERKRSQREQRQQEIEEVKRLGLMPQPCAFPLRRRETPREFQKRRQAYVQKYGAEAVKEKFPLSWREVFSDCLPVEE